MQHFSFAPGPSTFDNITIILPNTYALYVVKYSPAGVPAWVKTVYGNGGGALGEAMACTGAEDDCFVAAGIVYTVGFDNIYLSTSSFYTDLVLARLSNFTATSVKCSENSESIKIYPNPLNNSTTVRFSTTINNAEVNVYNLYGQKIETIKNSSGQEIEILRNNIPSGIYFVHLTQKNGTIQIVKLVITDN